jgi:hypothetical protein
MVLLLLLDSRRAATDLTLLRRRMVFVLARCLQAGREVAGYVCWRKLWGLLLELLLCGAAVLAGILKSSNSKQAVCGGFCVGYWWLDC